MHIELLLTDIAQGTPVMNALRDESWARLPVPAIVEEMDEPGPFFGRDRLNDLTVQKWGIVVERGAAHRMLEWIRPLRELRARQCGLASPDDVVVFRVDADMDRHAAQRWVASTYVQVPRHELPRYVLILGDLDQVSFELQQALAAVGGAFAGRLCFTHEDGTPDPAGYERYCAKILAVEEAPGAWTEDARVLFYASRPEGDRGLQTAYKNLIHQSFYTAKQDDSFPRESLLRFGRTGDLQWSTSSSDAEARRRTLLHWAQEDHPGVLLSVTHGAGIADPAHRRVRQGALVLGKEPGAERPLVLEHAYFAERAFLPRGFWFLQACFGAGTPAESVYAHWLGELAARNLAKVPPAEAVAFLAPSRQEAFVARLPQTTLANPRGPVAVLGHADMAFDYGYHDPGPAEVNLLPQAEYSPYYDVLRTVALGGRVANAAYSLTEKALQVGSNLAMDYGQLEHRGAASDLDPVRRVWQWLQYHDLSGYMLLGDPAAQLPIRESRRARSPCD